MLSPGTAGPSRVPREEAVAETSVNRTLTKFIGRLFRVKRDNAALETAFGG